MGMWETLQWSCSDVRTLPTEGFSLHQKCLILHKSNVAFLWLKRLLLAQISNEKHNAVHH